MMQHPSIDAVLQLYRQGVNRQPAFDYARYELLLEGLLARLLEITLQSLQFEATTRQYYRTLWRPQFYLAFYQWSVVSASDRHAVTNPGQFTPGSLAFDSYYDLGAVTSDDSAVAWMRQLQSCADKAAVRRLLERTSPCHQQSDESCGDVVDVRAAPLSLDESMRRVAVSLGLSQPEQLLLRVGTGGKVRFPRARFTLKGGWDGKQRHALTRRLIEQWPEQASIGELSFICYCLWLMPTAYVEQATGYFNRALDDMRGIRALVMGAEFQRKPLQLHYVALIQLRHGRVIGVQHGGGYAQTDPNWWERAERAMQSGFMSWGYQNNAAEQPLPAPKLSRLKLLMAARSRLPDGTGGAHPPGKRALLAIPFISDELQAAQFSPGSRREYAALLNTLSLLEPLLRSGWLFDLRCHPKNSTDGFARLISAQSKQRIRLIKGSRGELTQAIRQDAYDAVFFSSPHATGLAECSAARIPYQIVCMPGDFCILPSAEPVYEQMQQDGIWLTSQQEVEHFEQQKLYLREFDSVYFGYQQQFALAKTDYLADWVGMLNREIRRREAADSGDSATMQEPGFFQQHH